MTAPKVPLDDAKPLIWDFAERSSYATVACRAIKKLWADHRPKKGLIRGIVFMPGENPDQYVYVDMDLKSTRCTTNKSCYTIEVHSKARIVWIHCNETEVRMTCAYLTGRIRGRWNYPIASIAINGLDNSEGVWESVSVLLQGCLPFNPLEQPSETARERWCRLPRTNSYSKDGGFRCQVYHETGDERRLLQQIDINTGDLMPEWFKAIEMNAERMEPFHIYQAPVLPNTDRLYTFGSATK